MPSTPTAVPMASEPPIRSACTQKKAVGDPCADVPLDHALGSSQIATANLGQITHIQTPTPVRKRDQLRESTMAPQYASGALALRILDRRASATVDRAGHT